MDCSQSLPPKKVIVASFQRSGTHFLINTLASNFIGISDGWIDVVQGQRNQWVRDVTKRNLVDKIREQLVEKYHPAGDRRCVKTHYQAYFFERHLDSITNYYDVLYMIRDPRDTLVACYHYYNRTRFERFVREPDFSKFLRASLWDVTTETNPFSYSYVKPRHIVDKWNKHVLSWLPYRGRGVTFVRYDQLSRNLRETVDHIEGATCQKRKGALQPVSIHDKRYRPDFSDRTLPRGQLGAWRTYFNQDDLDFLFTHLNGDVCDLFDDLFVQSRDCVLGS